MSSGEKPVALSNDLSFETVLDQTCDRLWERKVQHSMRRIRSMEERLAELERELDGLVILRQGQDRA